MNDNTDDRVENTGYTLSTDSHDELIALRDSLRAMARNIYGPTAKGSLDPVTNLSSAQLGHTFDHVAYQLLQIVTETNPTTDVAEEPSQPQ